MQAAVKNHNGRIVKTTGDGLHAVFDSPTDAIAAALAGQQTAVAEAWPEAIGTLKIRMGVHTGESQERDGDYYGPEPNRAARVMDVAHGGQVFVSEVTAALIRSALPAQVSLADLGEHRLRGLAAPEKIFQLAHPALPSDFPPIRSLSAYKHNLPIRLSSFVGRENELAEVKALLADTRLLTLLGPGGTGKTRLALQAAADVIDQFPDGVWLVELAPLTDPALLPDQLANTLRVQEQPGRPLRDTLTDYLRPKKLLLLLDNVEHLVRECAEFSEHLLRSCPQIKLLVTGREALFIGAETTMQIPSLTLPESDDETDIDRLRSCEAVQLFLERLHNVHPQFELTTMNAPNVAEIVIRLDGIPLALELAAARLRMMSVAQIAARLNDRFRLLTGGRRTALPRQQTLQALIDWSWNLLAEDERTLLRRLSVFSSGWSLEAAEEVAGFDGVDALDGLAQLVNKSLVVVERLEDDIVRYHLLESIRQYSRDRLFDAGEGEILRDRHADYYVRFTQEADIQLYKRDMMVWVQHLRNELDNLRAVVAWTLDERPELTLRLSSLLHHYPGLFISPREAHEWLNNALNRTRGSFESGGSNVQPHDFIQALLALGRVSAMQGDNTGATHIFAETAALARQFGETRLLAYAIGMKGFVHLFQLTPELLGEAEEAIRICRENSYQNELVWNLTIVAAIHVLSGDFEKGDPYVAEAIEINAKQGTPHALANVLTIKAAVLRFAGNLAAAKPYYLQAIEKFTEIGAQVEININRSALAHILRVEGQLAEAEAIYRETIRGWQEQGQQPAIAHQLECFAFIAIAQDEHEHAARLLGAAKETRERLNSLSEDPREIAELEQALEDLAAGMSIAERDIVMSEGRLMSLDEAVAFALGNE